MKLLSAALAFSLLAGCDLADDCTENPNLQCYLTGAAGPGGAGGSGATGAGGPIGGNGGEGGDGGSGGAPPAECVLANGLPIGTECGVFVKEGGNGIGTQSDPFGSIAEAVAGLEGSQHRIYVCGGSTFVGSVTMDGAISIYGGIACNGWIFSEANPRAQLLGVAGEPALRILGDGQSQLQSLIITAPNAIEAGESSIALLVSEATLTTKAVDLEAGNGANGALPPTQVPPALDAQGGLMGANAGQANSNALGGINAACGGGLAGGAGGNGGLTPAGPGGTGGQGDVSLGGLGGIGQSGSSLNCGIGSGLGEGGIAGDVGDSGTLGDNMLGSLSISGFTPADGEPGMAGGFGTSGGGGGGSKAEGGVTGAGGGGGGAGGCGGLGGGGGKGGGSSIALVSLNAHVTLSADTELSVKDGGDAGDGAKGQLGQLRGAGGGGGGGANPIEPACAGGPGGNGGDGGNGAGGRGGSAIGIAYVGTQPTGGDIDVDGASAGAGGDGGDNLSSEPGANADPGTVVARLALPLL